MVIQANPGENDGMAVTMLELMNMMPMKMKLMHMMLRLGCMRMGCLGLTCGMHSPIMVLCVQQTAVQLQLCGS